MAELHLKNLSFLERGPYNLALQPGKILAISGESGAGKSLLLRAIADLEEHDGEMTLNGRSYLEFAGAEWRRKVMFLPAESHWWQEKVRDHLLHEPGAELLADIGFAPEVLDWEISRLSSGEKQRLAILRMLLHRPSVLLLDEPTASLDQKNIGKIEAMLKKYIAENQASAIWVSHDPAQIERVSDRHLKILAGGKLVQ